MSTTKPQPKPPRHKLRWYQFSLRSLFVFVTLCAFACSWFAVKRQQAETQRQAVAAILQTGGEVKYDYQFDKAGKEIPNAQPPAPAWARKLLGDDFFSNAAEARSETRDAIRHLRKLARLRRLDLKQANADGLCPLLCCDLQG